GGLLGEGRRGGEGGGGGRAVGLDGKRLGADGGVGGHIEAQLQAGATICRGHGGGDRLTAAKQRRGPARRHAGHRHVEPLVRQVIVLQAERDGGRGTGANRDRRIIGQKIEPLDVARCVLGARR